ncbi:hypothetical protein ACI3PF_19035, partial [Lactococcus lactis]
FISWERFRIKPHFLIESTRFISWRPIGRKLAYTWLYGDLNSSFYTYHHENKFINRYFDYLSGTSFSLDGPGNITGWFMLKAVQITI